MSCSTCAKVSAYMAAKMEKVLRHRERKQQAARQGAEHQQQGVEDPEGSSPDEGREPVPGVQEGGAGE